MAVNIGPRIGIEGEDAYRKAINGIIQQSKTLDAEFKAVSSSVANSANAENRAAEISRVLTAQVESQRERVRLLADMVEKATESTGENSDTTLRWKQALYEAQTRLNTVESSAADAGDSVEDMGDSMDDAGGSAVSFGDILKANVISDFILDGFRKLADAAKEFAKAMINTAADVKAETSQFSQTFGDFSDDATAAINRVAERSGILPTRLNTAASGIFAFARSSGGAVEESMSLMETALSAAADSAAYYDRSLEETTDTLLSFLKGNFANDAALGVSATETTRNAKAMELFGVKFNDLSEIQKQKTLLKMVTDAQKLSGAMGQAAREADGWENVQGNLNETWRQFQAQVGTPFLDALIPVVQDLTTRFTEWRESVNWEEFSDKVAGFAEHVLVFGNFIVTNGSTILSVLTGIGAAFATWQTAAIVMQIVGYFQQFSSITEVLTAAQAALNSTMLANPFVLVATLIVGLVTAFVTLYKTNDEFRAKVDETWAAVRTTVRETVDSVISLVKNLWTNIRTTVGNIKQTVVNGFTGAFNSVRDAVTNIASTIRNIISGLISSALGWGSDMINGLAAGIRNAIGNVVGAISSVAQTIASWIHFSRPDTGPLREYEKWMPDMIHGMAAGIRRNAYVLEDALAGATEGMQIGVTGAAGAATTNYGGVQITVNAQDGQSAQEIANYVFDLLQHNVDKRGAAYV